LQETERVRWEEQRKAQQQDAYNKQEVAKYQDQLARQRSEAEHQKHRERNLELVRLQVLSSVVWHVADTVVSGVHPLHSRVHMAQEL
jgi:Domain of unknown function (DUF3523)